MEQIRIILKAFLVPALMAVYMVFFWRSTSGIPLGGQGMPRLLIIALGVLLLLIVVREVVALRSRTAVAGRPAPPAGDPTDAAPTVPPAPPEPTGAASPEPTATDTPPVTPAASTAGAGKPVAVAVALLAYWGLLTRIGAYPSTALFVIGLSLALGYRRPLAIAGSAVVCVVLVYFFIRIFNLPLPGWAWF